MVFKSCILPSFSQLIIFLINSAYLVMVHNTQESKINRAVSTCSKVEEKFKGSIVNDIMPKTQTDSGKSAHTQLEWTI